MQYPDYIFTKPFAATGDKNPIPEQQAVSGNGSASMDTGFPVECQKPIRDGGIPPDRLDFNGILNLITVWLTWICQGGQAKWSNTTAYQVGALVEHNGKIYLSKRANTNSQPR